MWVVTKNCHVNKKYIWLHYQPKLQTNSDYLGKQKIQHATIVARFWDQICPKSWSENILKK